MNKLPKNQKSQPKHFSAKFRKLFHTKKQIYFLSVFFAKQFHKNKLFLKVGRGCCES